MFGKNSSTVVAAFVLSAVFIYLYPMPAEATSYYVAPTGSDSNSCSQSQPCRTIGHGISVAAGAGNVLYVQSGTYTESPTINAGGASGNKFNVQGFAPGSSCPTTTTGTDAYTPMGRHPAPTALIIGHVTISANFVQLQCIELEPNPSEGIQYQPGYDLSHSGIAVSPSYHDVDIWDNYIHKNGSLTSPSSTDGLHAYSKAISLGTIDQPVSNITVQRNYMNHAAAQITGYTCSSGCVSQDNEINGYDVEVYASGYDGDYNETAAEGPTGTTAISYVHDYNHGADEAWCQFQDGTGTPGHCHTDCYESSAWGNHGVLLDRIVCFNMNQAVYFWDCTDSSCTTPMTYGSYLQVYDITVRNSLFAFGNGRGFQVCMDVWHAGNVKWDNNTCWGTAANAVRESQITSFENNIQYQTYQNGASCFYPYGVNVNGEISTDGSKYLTNQNNILYNDTQCSIGTSGSGVSYGNDIRNSNPLFISPGTYSNTVGANMPNLHLQSNTPAKGAGSNLFTSFTDDLDGNTRPNAPFDIGMYMLLSGSGPTSPTNLLAKIN